MKLPAYQGNDRADLTEFDVWVTPSLGEIRDTDRFKRELDHLVNGFEALRSVTSDFRDESMCRATTMGAALRDVFGQLPTRAAFEFLAKITSVIYLATGKTDNNAKCQFPLYLRDKTAYRTIPAMRKNAVVQIPVPRVLDGKRLNGLTAKLAGHPDQQAALFQGFLEFLLSDEHYVSQLWCIGHSYVKLAQIGKGRDLLAPLAIFQVRGSVSASGGHTPENVLRQRLLDWGLWAGRDYNTADFVVTADDDRGSAGAAEKTRAFDFAVPVSPRNGGLRLLIQSQFYAGDSGSVSHKNVDQVRKSRDATKALCPDSRFVEYVDGAGYFASLNGDLEKLLRMRDTASFFQIRSAPIRLRREIQGIGLLSLLEVEHAIFVVGPEISKVRAHVSAQGYAVPEIDSCVTEAVTRGALLRPSPDELAIHPSRRAVARRYFLLDVAAVHGAQLGDRNLSGFVLVPGYGPFYGIKQNELVREAARAAPLIRQDWRDPGVALDDLQWLLDPRQAFLMAGR
jgi:hypothetical protein